MPAVGALAVANLGQREAWEPCREPGLAGWWDAAHTRAYDQPCLVDGNMEEASCSTQPALVDGDMEAADTAAWSAYQATITKETGSPHSGIRCLRVAYDGSHTYGSAYQTPLTAGRCYRARGYARSVDGVALPYFQKEGATVWTGSNSVAWQSFDVTFAATGATIYLSSDNLAAGRAVEFDDITIEDVSAPAWTASTAILSKMDMGAVTGKRCLRVASASSVMGYASQSCMTVGGVYHITGWGRGNGTTTPTIYGGGTLYWTGTTSNTWQRIDVYGAQTTNATLNPFGTFPGSVGYVEFDDLQATRVYIADGDMEASGLGYWTAINGATLTKSTSAPHSGTQALRIAGGANRAARQATLASGAVYRLRGYARGDGSGHPEIYDNAVQVWVGTSSTAWQAFDITYKTTNIVLDLYTVGPGSWVEFDDVVIEPAFLLDGDMELAPPSNPTLVDGDMEAADTAAWSNYNATLSKQTGTPHGGTRCLRVAYNGSGAWGDGGQTILTVGRTYHVTGWYRGDGTSKPGVILGGAGTYVEGTSSTAWQAFDLYGVCAGSGVFALYSPNLGAGTYVEFDDVTITDVTATAWSTFQSIASKSTVSPHSGTRALRCSFDGTNAYGMVGQAYLTAGQWYRVRGWARGDGTITCNICNNGGTSFWTSTTSTSWQYFDVVFTPGAAATSIWFRHQVFSAGHWFEVDDVTIEPISASGLLDLSGHQRHCNQATLTKQPAIVQSAINGQPVARFDGVDDYIKATFPLKQPETVILVSKPTKQADARYLIDGSATNSMGMYHGAADLLVRIYSGGPGFTGPSFVDATPGIFAALYNGASSSIAYNGGAATTGNAGTTAAEGLTVGAVGGASGFYCVEDVAEIVAYDHALDSHVMDTAVKYFKDKYGIT